MFGDFSKMQTLFFYPFPPFFPARLCFEALPPKSIGRPLVLPLQSLAALQLAQFRHTACGAAVRCCPLISLAQSARVAFLGPLGLATTATVARAASHSRRRRQVGTTCHPHLGSRPHPTVPTSTLLLTLARTPRHPLRPI